MPDSVCCLIKKLKVAQADLSLEKLFQIVRGSHLSIRSIEDRIEYCKRNYKRNTLAAHAAFQILLICWKPGQFSQIHDHSGSRCVVKVLAGTAVETQYVDPDNAALTSTVRYSPGSVFGGEDGDIHVVGNPKSARTGLVTMHIYAPALTDMRLFEIDGGRLKEVVAAVS
ncbi:MAG: cysteine dioxygenase family protein [Fuerstiella sp.]